MRTVFTILPLLKIVAVSLSSGVSVILYLVMAAVYYLILYLLRKSFPDMKRLTRRFIASGLLLVFVLLALLLTSFI